MEKSIKDRTAHYIHYGVDRDTGEIKHISDVPSGEKCGCNCVVCKTPLIARKGTEREHHFAHVSNNDCIYGNEIAIYLIANDVMCNLSSLYLPPITQRTPTGGEYLVKARSEISIKEVSYQCGLNQYPPEFFVTTHEGDKDYRLRILFGFDRCDFEGKLSGLEKAARENDYSLLLYYFPCTEDHSFFKRENLEKIFTVKTDVKTYWVRSAYRDNEAKQQESRPADERKREEPLVEKLPFSYKYSTPAILPPNSLKGKSFTRRRRGRF